MISITFSSGQTLSAGTHICSGIPTKFVNQDYVYSNQIPFFTNTTETKLGGLKSISFISGGTLCTRGNANTGVMRINAEILLPYPDFVV